LGHTWPQVPQFAGSSKGSTHAPPPSPLAPQTTKPGTQVPAHVPSMHMGLPKPTKPAGLRQTWPQEPQLFGSVRRDVSQPFARLPSQLSEPELQVTPHAPSLHVAVPPGTGGHDWPHWPQLFKSVLRSTQRSRQWVRPGLQETPHDPELHVGLPLPFAGPGHTWPQAPQFAVSLGTHTPPQLRNPGLQAKPHVVPSQEEVAFAGGVQGVQLAPQLDVLLLLTHAPPHSWKPGPQAGVQSLSAPSVNPSQSLSTPSLQKVS
jgi:hypothetical protein